jgi:hypothetical protein
MNNNEAQQLRAEMAAIRDELTTTRLAVVAMLALMADAAMPAEARMKIIEGLSEYDPDEGS